MEETIELRLAGFAGKVASMYKDRIEPKYYEQLCNTIKVCIDYHVNNKGDWWIMYDAVLGDDGIWEYAFSSCFSEEIQEMWILVTDILSCNCYLGCIAEDNSTPEDLELRGENIPQFVELLEKLIGEQIDYNNIFEFWGNEVCY